MGNPRIDKNEMYGRFPETNKEKYSYDWSTYRGGRELMKMWCPVHGEFWQRPCDHAKGCGCRKCGSKKTGDKLRKSTEEFIAQAIMVHGLKFGYDKVIYVNGHDPVIVTCPIHGDFLVKPLVHLKGCDCPRCERDNHIYPGGVGQYHEKYFERNSEMKDHFGLLYLVKIESLDIVKLGITKDEGISKRFSHIKKQTGSQVSQVNLYITTLYDAFLKERDLLKRYSLHRLSLDQDFAGKTECFPASMESRLDLEISDLIQQREARSCE